MVQRQINTDTIRKESNASRALFSVGASAKMSVSKRSNATLRLSVRRMPLRAMRAAASSPAVVAAPGCSSAGGAG